MSMDARSEFASGVLSEFLGNRGFLLVRMGYPRASVGKPRVSETGRACWGDRPFGHDGSSVAIPEGGNL